MKNIVLIGFMGSGKDTIGEILARKTGLHYISIDKAIELNMDMKIPDIFRKLGESRFRKEENKIVRSIKDIKGCIISTGGGTVVNDSNKRILKKSGNIVNLKTSLKTIKKRLKNRKGRPLLDSIGVEILYKRRHDTYAFADTTITTDNQNPQSIAKEILNKINLNHSTNSKQIKQQTIQNSNSYPVITGHKILEGFNDYIKKISSSNSKIFIVTDRTTGSLYLTDVLQQRKQASHLVINGGEKQKTLRTASQIYNFLLSHKADRDDIIIALGGGVIGDVTGFIASTYKRGMKLIHIPTTLLAQVDSSIGGKTGINHKDGKNMIGTFYNPAIVISDISLLQTLPDKEYRNGLAEVIKYGLIKDKQLFNLLLNKSRQILNREPEILYKIVSRSVETKLSIANKDQTETESIRELLNFGHTIGHAIETITGYKRYSHGEAITIGMVLESMLCQKLGFKVDLNQIYEVVNRYELPTHLPENITTRTLNNTILQDKKIRGDFLNMPVLTTIGTSKVIKVRKTVLEKLLKYCLSTY